MTRYAPVPGAPILGAPIVDALIFGALIEQMSPVLAQGV
jgi:hypothetical protein